MFNNYDYYYQRMLILKQNQVNICKWATLVSFVKIVLQNHSQHQYINCNFTYVVKQKLSKNFCIVI